MDYQVSEDYAKLWDLARNGALIVCFVDYRRDAEVQDVAKVVCTRTGVEVRARGVVYIESNSPAEFDSLCREWHLQWIVGIA